MPVRAEKTRLAGIYVYCVLCTTDPGQVARLAFIAEPIHSDILYPARNRLSIRRLQSWACQRRHGACLL